MIVVWRYGLSMPVVSADILASICRGGRFIFPRPGLSNIFPCRVPCEDKRCSAGLCETPSSKCSTFCETSIGILLVGLARGSAVVQSASDAGTAGPPKARAHAELVQHVVVILLALVALGEP